MVKDSWAVPHIHTCGFLFVSMPVTWLAQDSPEFCANSLVFFCCCCCTNKLSCKCHVINDSEVSC